MCGRFESKADQSILISLVEQLEINIDYIEDGPEKNVNIAPTEKILALTKAEEKYQLRKFNWGIKFSPDSPLIFNSRIETICEKKFWKDLFNKNRCLVPMTAFYEWKKENDRKVPYRIFLKEHELFFVPGLFQKGQDKNMFVSLITTTPNEFIKPIHHRMPVIFTKETAMNYFNNSVEENLKYCIPFVNYNSMDMERITL